MDNFDPPRNAATSWRIAFAAHHTTTYCPVRAKSPESLEISHEMQRMRQQAEEEKNPQKAGKKGPIKLMVFFLYHHRWLQGYLVAYT